MKGRQSFPGVSSPNFISNSAAPRSPVTPGKQGNKTGNERHISDTVAEFYNLVQKWNKYHIDGVAILTSMAQLIRFDKSKIEKPSRHHRLQYQPENLPFSESFYESESDSEGESNGKPSAEELQDLSHKLLDIYKSLETVCNSMKTIQQNLYTMTRLMSDEPVFCTWTVSKFYCNGYITIVYDSNWWFAYIPDKNKDQDEVKVTSLHPKGPSSSFSYPKRPDILWLSFMDVLCTVNPTGRFYVLSKDDISRNSHAEEVAKCYQAELEVKLSVVENIALSSTKDALMFYIAAWTYQIFIEERTQTQVTTMAKEAKLL